MTAIEKYTFLYTGKQTVPTVCFAEQCGLTFDVFIFGVLGWCCVMGK